MTDQNSAKQALRQNAGDITVTVSPPQTALDIAKKNYIVPFERHTPEQQAEMETIIAQKLDTANPDTAMTFGSDTLKKTGDVSQRIYDLMAEDRNSVFRKPIVEMLDTITSLDLDVLQESIDGLLREGGNVVKHNKGALAVTGALALTGQFWAAGMAGGYTAMQEMVRRKREATTLRDKPEVIEERLRGAIAVLNAKFREVEEAATHAPRIMERINTIAYSNHDAFNALRMEVSAGREKLHRVTEEELPVLEQRALEDPRFENDEAVEKAREFVTNLDRSLRVLEIATAESVVGTSMLADAKKAVNDTLVDLRSLVNTEKPLVMRTAVTAGLALDSYRTTKVTQAFRDHVAGLQEDTVKVAMLAQKTAEDGRIDNPERLKKMVDRINDLRTHLESQRTRTAALEQQSAEQRERMHEATVKLIETMTKTEADRVKIAAPRETKSLQGPTLH